MYCFEGEEDCDAEWQICVYLGVGGIFFLALRPFLGGAQTMDT